MKILSVVVPPLVIFALLACAGGQLSPKAQRQIDVFECRVRALQPYVGEVLDVAEVVRDAIRGKADPGAAILGLGGTPDDVRAAAKDWHACDPKTAQLPVLTPG